MKRIISLLIVLAMAITSQPLAFNALSVSEQGVPSVSEVLESEGVNRKDKILSKEPTEDQEDSYVYKLVDNIIPGKEYLIVNKNTCGSGYALKSDGGSVDGTKLNNFSVSVKKADIDNDGIEDTFIYSTEADIEWKATAKGEGFDLTNGTDYLEGKSGEVKVFSEQQYPDRHWTYVNDQLKQFGGDNAYTVYFKKQFTSTYVSSDEVIYIYEKTYVDIIPNYFFKLVDNITPGREYLIVNKNEAGSAYALANKGATSDGTSLAKNPVDIASGDIDNDGIIDLYIDSSDSNAVWMTTAENDGFSITNGTDYLEGKAGIVKIFSEQQYPDRYWAYSNNQLKNYGGENAYTIYFSGDFTSTYHSSNEVIYVYEKTSIPKASITIYSFTGDSETREINVGDSFTVFTTLNVSKLYSSGMIAAIEAKQTYTADTLSVNNPYGFEDLFINETEMFPVIGDSVLARHIVGAENESENNTELINTIYYSASKPEIDDAFQFNSDDDIVIATSYKVTKSGEGEIRNTLNALALADENLTKVVYKGVIDLDFDCGVSFDKPEIPTEASTTTIFTDTVDIYFTDTLGWVNLNDNYTWNDYVYVYYWYSDYSIKVPEWPGVTMEKYKVNDYGQQIYKAVVPADVYGILFCGNGGQTTEINEGIVNDSWWYPLNEQNSHGDYLVQTGPAEVPVVNPTQVGTSETYTIYFYNNKSWDNVNVYMWNNGADEFPAWPGVPATLVGKNQYGFDVYSITVDTSVYDYVIFNGSVGQTVDISIAAAVAGGCGVYCMDTTDRQGHYDVDFFEYTPITPVDPTYPPVQPTEHQEKGEDVTMYFTNNKGWSNVYAYVWNSTTNAEVAEWPGLSATLVGKNSSGEDVYSIYIPAEYDMVIFNGFGQTRDISVSEAVTGGMGIYCLNTQVPETGAYDVGFYEYTPIIPVDPTDPPLQPTEHQEISEDVTLYFTNNKGWSNVNAYVWNDSTSARYAEWPGLSATLVGKNSNGEDVYSIYIPAEYDMVIFNGSGGQTRDISVYEAVAGGCGIYWVGSGLDVAFYEYTGLGGGDEPTTEPEYPTSSLLSHEVKNLHAASIYSTAVKLAWNEHTNENVVSYVVLRDGEEIATTSKFFYVDYDLDTGREYTYSVYGVTNTGDHTATASITLTPHNMVFKEIKTNHPHNTITPNDGKIIVKAQNEPNTVDLYGNPVYGKMYYIKNGEREFIDRAQGITLEDTEFTVDWDVSDIDDGEYEVVFVYKDPGNETIEFSGLVNVNKHQPDKIINVVGLGGYDDITVSWSRSSEVDSNTYKIFRKAEDESEFSLLTTINSRDILNYSDTNVENDKIYYYYVVAVDSFGMFSPQSDVAVARRAVDTNPPVVTEISPANYSFINGTQVINVKAIDNLIATRSELYYKQEYDEWIQVTGNNETPFRFVLDSRVLPDGEISVKAVAFDANGNQSEAKIVKYYVDNSGPSVVTGMTASKILASKITLKWNDVSDDDVESFTLEMKENNRDYSVAADGIETLGYTLENLKPNTEYTFRVAAVDTRGNKGDYSQELVVCTTEDTIPPTITELSPTASRIKSNIYFTAKAGDDCAIKYIYIQTSRDLKEWKTVSKAEFPNVNKTAAYSFNIDISKLSDGSLYVRAVAEDYSGNLSPEGDSAAFVEYMIDNTSPGTPRDFMAVGGDRWIYLSWLQGDDTDLDSYSLFRSTSKDSGYTLIVSGLRQLDYYDTTVQRDTMYFYKLAVLDTVGNVSEMAGPVSSQIAHDTEAPEVLSVSPATNSCIGVEYHTIQALVKDNNCIDYVDFEMKVNQEQSFRKFNTVNNVNSYMTTVSSDIPLEGLKDGDKVYVRISCTDIVGLVSEYSYEYEYNLDSTAPAIKNPSIVHTDGTVSLTWQDNREEDLAGFKIYRINAYGSSAFIGSRSNSSSNQYSIYDYLQSVGSGDYVYRIVAFDTVGNSSEYLTKPVSYTYTPPVQENQAPVAVINGMSDMEVNVEEYFDAYASTDDNGIVSYTWSFGDGTVSTDIRPHKRYKIVGTFTVTLTVADEEGLTDTFAMTVTVHEREAIGTLNVKIEDETGASLPYAPVYFYMGTEKQKVLYSDASGTVSYKLESGSSTIGSYQSGYLPVTKEITVLPNAVRTITLTLVKEEIVTGRFEIHRMTFNEIQEAGIDIYNPANQNVYSVKVTIHYRDSEIPVEYIRNEDKILTYRVTDVDNSHNSSGGTGGYNSHTTTYPYIRLPGSDSTIAGITYIPNKDNQEIIALLEMNMTASTLKEFFDVRLHIVNNATTDYVLRDNKLDLRVPNGLTVMNGLTGDWSTDTHVEFDSLRGQDTHTISWVLRGDKIGEYQLEADYSSTLELFEAPVTATFKTEEPIKVYGLSDFSFELEYNNTIKYNALYFNIGLKNNGTVDLYNPQLDFDGIVSNITASAFEREDESDSKVECRLLGVRHVTSDGNERYCMFNAYDSGRVTTDIDTLAPGDKLYYEYVAYNLVDYDEVAYFDRAAYEVLEGYGATVNITHPDMDLYKVYDPEAKLNKIRNNSKTQNAVEYLLDNNNYISVANSKDASSFGSHVVNALDLLLTLDFDVLTQRDLEDKIDTILVSMMTDQGVYDEIDDLIDTSYIKASKEILGYIGNFADTFNFYEKDYYGVEYHVSDGVKMASIVKDALSNEKTLYKLRNDLKYMDGDEMINQFIFDAGLGAFTSVIKFEISKHLFSFDDPESPMLKGLFEGFADVGKHGSKVLEATVINFLKTTNDVNKREALYNLLQMEACKQESILLLNSIYTLFSEDYESLMLADPNITDNVKSFLSQSNSVIKRKMKERAQFLRNEIENNSYNLIQDAFGTFVEYTAETTVKVGSKLLLKSVIGKASIYYALLGTAYEVAKDTFKIGEGYEAAQSYLITSFISQAAMMGYSEFERAYGNEDNYKLLQTNHLLSDLGYKVNNRVCAESALLELKFLVQSRLLGEQAFKKFISDDNATLFQSDEDYDKEAVEQIDSFFGIDAADIEEAFDYIYGNILSARDTIFNEESGEVMLKPLAPYVSINYSKLETNEVFDSSYEYCYSDGEWHDCKDLSHIKVKPKETLSLLRVRKKAAKGYPSGKITTVTVYARKPLSKLISARYDAGTYSFSNMSSKYSYEVSPVDDLINGEFFNESVLVEGGYQATTSGLPEKDYVRIRTKQNDELLELNSKSRIIPVEKRQKLRVITEGDGSVVQTRPDSMYFKGDDVTLTAVEDNSLFVGWYIDGQLISKADTYLLEMYDNAVITAKFDVGNVVPAESITLSLGGGYASVGSNYAGNANIASTGADPDGDCYEGKTKRFEVEFTPANTTDKTITWSSSKEDVLAVNRNGVVNMKSAGVSTVTAVAASGVSATYTVRVLPNSVTELCIEALPYDVSCVEGGTFSTEGMYILAQFADGGIGEITDYTISSIDLTTAGEKTVTVSKGSCSANFTVTVDHVPEWVTTVAPTCQSEGVSSCICRYCSELLDTETIPMTDHDYEWMLTKDASDTEDGVLSYKCKICGDISQTKPLSSHTHDYVVTVTQPTCTKDGYELHECSVCGYSFEVHPDAVTGTNLELLATQHQYDDETVEASCSHIGYTKHTCSVCGDTYIDDVVDKVDHNYAYRTVAPTCEHQGYYEEYCTICSESNKSYFTDKLAHIYRTQQVEATCEHGAGLQYTCEMCGQSYIAGEGEKLNHNYETTLVSASCTQDGYTLHTCKNCGESYKTDIVKTTGHTFGLWMVREPSNPDRRGLMYRVCTRCSEEETKFTEKSTHVHQPGKIETVADASCEEYGVCAYCCTICGDMIETEMIVALGHDYVESIVEPSCTEKGYTLSTCKHCGDSYRINVIPAKDHSIGDWEITKEADCVSSGFRIKKCSACGEILQQERIDALGHVFNEIEIPPTYTNAGYTLHYCVNCDYHYEENFTIPKDYIVGDADGNGEVEIIDVTYLQRYLAEIVTPFTKAELIRGDADGSGDLEIIDATLIQRYLVNFSTPYSVGELISASTEDTTSTPTIESTAVPTNPTA